MPKFLLFLLSFPQNESLESCLFFLDIQLSIKVLFSKIVLQIGEFPVCYPFCQKKRILRKVEKQNDRIITSYNSTSVSLFITFYAKEYFCYFVYQNEQTETKELLKLINL